MKKKERKKLNEFDTAELTKLLHECSASKSGGGRFDLGLDSVTILHGPPMTSCHQKKKGRDQETV